MKEFKYKYLAYNGEWVHVTIEAKTETEAIKICRDKGYTQLAMLKDE